MPPPPRPAGFAARRPSEAQSAKSGQVRAKPLLPPRPPKWLRQAATLSLLLPIAVLVLAGILEFVNMNLKNRIGDLPRLELQAEAIKEAYSELAEHGGILKARLDNSAITSADLKHHVHTAAKMAGIKVQVGDPVRIDGPKGTEVFKVTVTGTGPEERMLEFLGAVDELPAVVKIETVDLTGVASGRASMDLTLHHFQFGKRLANRYREFVEKLPAVTPPKRPSVRMRRAGDLFLPSVVSSEEAGQGWPNVTINGFTADKALFFVDGEDHSIALGQDLTDDITYIDKLAVNQAMLKRKSDGAEIILTIGSRTFALKPQKARGMSEFILTLQKRATSDLLAPAREQ